MNSISAIIPNYNGCDLLERNLPSLFRELELADVDYEVIVVDDRSTDNSVDFLRNNYPQVIVVEQKKNGGFSASCNAGIRTATKSLIFLMNSDIKLTSNYFKPQLKYFEKSCTFGVMGQIIGYYDDKVQDTAKWPTTNGLKIKSTNNYYVENGDKEFWTPSFYLSGANALINSEKLKALSGFDEIFSPYYSEDLDLSVRAWRLGWKCYYESQSVCRHEGSVTTNKLRKGKVDIIYRRNRFIFHGVHYDGWHKVLYNLQVVFELLFKWINLKFGIYFGFKEYLLSSKAIKASKAQLRQSLPEGENLYSIHEVIEKIREEVKPYEVKML